jgi:hypothetical protein
MKHSLFSLIATLAGWLALASPALCQTATQNITLTAGWNAVWLEVEPVHETGTNAGQAKAPQDVFTNTAIQVVATPKPLAGPAEYFASAPGTITTFNQDEWQQWKRTDVANSNNLPMIFGNRPYLIQVAANTATFSLPVAGKARFFRPTWIADRYNLIGFGLDGTRTFDQFFGPAGGKHPVTRIFRLKPDGSWETVTGGMTMTSNQAYWIFAAGPSTYMGPVAVDFDQSVAGRLDFGGPADAVAVDVGVDALELDLKEITFTNLGAASASPELDLIASSVAGIALHVVKPTTNTLGYRRGNQVDSAIGAGASAALDEAIASRQTAALTLGASRGWNIAPIARTNLYRLKTGGAGASFWLPITAVNSEIQQLADLTTGAIPAAFSGLWAGEVIINAATSIVEDGAPSRPTAGSAPLRLLLHSDAGGAVRLLSQVTLMQTKTADPSVPGSPVLVVDPAKIPFFEGIKERNGKRAGVRLESIAYDMPRRSDAWTGPDLAGLATRPPALQERYDLSKAMAGALGAGKTVTGTITLDPFHRSNPFRHAYHQNLPKGPQITRSIEVVFSADQATPDRLKGTFKETIQGLLKSNLTVSGSVEMHRISPVSTLE